MTETEKLRAMLDERGAEWADAGKRLNIGNGRRVPIETEFPAGDGRVVTAVQSLAGTLCIRNLTSEQAVAVTLGPGECWEMESDGWYKCPIAGAGWTTKKRTDAPKAVLD